uniref:B30.2/SPRY domain-containing protein n=1 Tax=Peronospora matthiolae TaxID=2874970 RepID=A0AAV1UYN7_9STRA
MAMNLPLDYKQRHVLQHFYFTRGCHYWEVIVERMDDLRGVVVGVASSETFETGASEDVGGDVATDFIVNSGVEICTAHAIDGGDTVGVYLDVSAREVAFFRNDEAQHSLREAEGEETVNDETEVSRVVAAGDEARELRTNRTFVSTKRISWHSF